jgi:hypothetical protein
MALDKCPRKGPRPAFPLPKRITVPIETFKITFTPQEKAQFELMNLATDKRFQQDFVLGGRMPPSMIAKNKKIAARCRKEELRIIKKYQVIAEHALPLVQEIKELQAQLRYTKRELKEYQAICEHKRQKNGKCLDCDAPLKKSSRRRSN